jgi:periplasmic protein TonB
MTNPEPTSTNSTDEFLEKADRQPSLVSVSEENLAALLRATASSGEREPQHTEKYREAISHTIIADDGIPAAAPQIAVTGPESSTSSPSQSVESRLALFAAVKEHRTAIRSGVTLGVPSLDQPQVGKASAKPATERYENLSARLAPEVAPLQITLPESQPLIPESIADPVAAIGGDRVPYTLRSPFLIAVIVGVVIAVGGVFAFLIRPHLSTTQKLSSSVMEPSGAIAKESVLSLSSPISSGQQPGKPPETPREQITTAKPQYTTNTAANVDAPQPTRLKVRSFSPPTAQRNTEQSTIVDAPPTLPNGSATPPVVSLPPSLGPISPPPVGNGASQQQVRVESNVQAANLLKKVIPIYPPIAKSAGIQGTVRFTAVIGKDGRTQDLKLTSGPSMLVDAASAAVKQWVYRPMLLNGMPTEVLTQIDVSFNLSGGPNGLATPPAVGLPQALTPISTTQTSRNEASQQQVRVESKVQTANLIKEVIPIYPPLAKAAGIHGTVRFTAVIGKDGRIRDLKLTSGPSVLADAASAAVKQWVYRPTLLNGMPTEVLTQIDVSFN